MSGEVESVSGCVLAAALEVLALSGCFETMLGKSSSCCLIAGLEGVRWDLAGARVGGGEFPPLSSSRVEGRTSG